MTTVSKTSGSPLEFLSKSSRLTSLSVLLLTFAFLIIASCESKYKDSTQHAQRAPEELQEKYDKIQEEMTEEQVGAIMSGYRAISVGLTEKVGETGRPLKRTSKTRIVYRKSEEPEGGWFVIVYFDQDGYAVGKFKGAGVK
jgi:hypothetical protein